MEFTHLIYNSQYNIIQKFTYTKIPNKSVRFLVAHNITGRGELADPIHMLIKTMMQNKCPDFGITEIADGPGIPNMDVKCMAKISLQNKTLHFLTSCQDCRWHDELRGAHSSRM